MVHFALFLVKISINFSPSYSTVFFSITVYVSTTVQKFQNFCTHSGIIGNYRELSGIIGNYRELSGIIGNYRELSGIIGSEFW
jgi:hypothetical protein